MESFQNFLPHPTLLKWKSWLQALSDYLALEDLSSTCEFPDEIDSLGKMLVSAEELQSVRQRLSAEMADHSGMIRTLVVRAEDSRLMMDM